jgi:hypothetical protein
LLRSTTRRLDPWLAACLLALVPLAVRLAGAPLGEPIAEDVDFIHHAMFGAWSWFDGGGSDSFWRPIPHQLYYTVFGRLILLAPWTIAVVHFALLGLGTVLLYRALRRSLGAPEAAFVATVPLLTSSTRVLVTWPTQFVELGAWLFVAIAVHQWTKGRAWAALLALAAALQTKEIALVAIVLLPLLPTEKETPWRERVRFGVASLVLATAWALVYTWVRASNAMEMPHGMEERLRSVGADAGARLLWAVKNGVRALLSLPAVHAPQESAVLGAFILLLAAAAAIHLLDARARERLIARLPWLAWGGAWFALASLVTVAAFPYWAPMRTLGMALGFALVLVAFVGTAHRGLLAALAALRVGAFLLAPLAPQHVSTAPPETGAWADYQRVTRLQRLARETREALAARMSAMPAESVVSFYFLPRDAEYIFGGDRWLQIRYGDPTLRFESLPALLEGPRAKVAAFVGFEPWREGAEPGASQMVVVPPASMKSYVLGREAIERGEGAEAMARLGEAERALGAERADVFRAAIGGATALALLELGQNERAREAAAASLERFDGCVDAHVALIEDAIADGRTAWASLALERLRAVAPDEAIVTRLAQSIRETREGRRPPRLSAVVAGT